MKIIQLILIVCFASLAFLRCSTQNKSRCKLTIFVDSNFDFELLENVILTSNNFNSQKYWIDSIDTFHKNQIYFWDSLKQGNYDFTVRDVFNEENRITLDLTKDTSIVIQNFKQIDSKFIEFKELNNSDTIQIVYKADGCFSSAIIKCLLVKNRFDSGNYTLTTHTRINEKYNNSSIVVDHKIIDMLYTIEASTIPPKTKDGSNIPRCVITTIQSIFIKADGKIFKFHDNSFYTEWNGFDELRSKYIEQTKE